MFLLQVREGRKGFQAMGPTAHISQIHKQSRKTLRSPKLDHVVKCENQKKRKCVRNILPQGEKKNAGERSMKRVTNIKYLGNYEVKTQLLEDYKWPFGEPFLFYFHLLR